MSDDQEIGFHRRAAMEQIEKQERALPPNFGPKPGHLRKAEIERQITALAGRLVQRMQRLDVHLAQGGTAELERISGTLKRMLFSNQESTREAAASAIVAALLDIGEATAPEFWCTDLGRALAREIGWVSPLAPRVFARNILHVSRQAVDQMVTRGALDAGRGHQPPAVTRDSLRRAAEARWPRESDV
jgi:hypothetical protein